MSTPLPSRGAAFLSRTVWLGVRAVVGARGLAVSFVCHPPRSPARDPTEERASCAPFGAGEIAFGLVTIPAKLYSATKDSTPQFHQLHKECGTRISLVRRCPKCARDLTWDEIGKGYEVSKGEYALFSKEELEKSKGRRLRRD